MRRIVLASLVFSLLLFGRTADAAPLWGGYVWGGYLAPSTTVNSFYQSVALSLSHGLKLIRFAVGDYPGNETDCQTGPTLACYAKIQFAGTVWDDTRLKSVMLTAIDRTCSSVDAARCFTPSWLAANGPAVIAEYVQLFDVLYQRFGSRHIEFVLSNWESDNTVNCGDAFDYSSNHAGFAAQCNASYPAEIATATERAHGIMVWFALRDQAVAQFVAAHPGFRLVHAPEFNVDKAFSSGCGGQCDGTTAAVIDQIRLSGGRKYCSYSSYESQGPTYASQIRDLTRICHSLIIGEFGEDLNLFTSAQVLANFRYVAQALPYVHAIVPWNAIDEKTGARYGLFTNAGQPDQLVFLEAVGAVP